MIGKLFHVPSEVCDSGLIRIVGSEKRAHANKFKVRGSGDVAYWCVEVSDGKLRGFAFAVGSDELSTWKAAPDN